MKPAINFIFELGQLKRIRREGWWLVGVEQPETVADHSLRAAQIGFILAKLEGYENPYEVCTIVAFHDIAECRTGDIHRVAKRYVKRDEDAAVMDQTHPLGGMGKDIYDIWKKCEDMSTTAGVIAKDADLLEQAFTAKEYMERGFVFTQDWINNISKALRTKSAKNLLSALESSNSNDWWQGLKKL